MSDTHNMPVIDDNNWRDFVNPLVDGVRMRCASYGMFRPDSTLRNKTVLFSEQATVPKIPKSEWDDIIRQNQKDKTTIRDFALDMGIEVLDQGQTNYCWANGPTFAMMLTLAKQTGIEHRLSPASVAAPVTGFKNVGGWGEMALEYMISDGINYQDDWPPNAIQRSYYTAENKEKAKQNIVTTWVRTTDWEEAVSLLLSGVPTAMGFNHWRHLICGTGVTLGDHNLEFANSWKTSWGDQGYGILAGQKKYFDGEAVAIIDISPQ